MKVVHIITGLRIGGAENQLQLLLRHSRAEAEVIALTNADEVAEAIRHDGVPVHALDMKGNRDVLAVIKLARWLRALKPDIVHLHLYRATLYGRLAARLANVPVAVTTEHSLLDGRIEGRPTTTGVRALYMATEPFNAATIAVSREVHSRLLDWGVPDQKLRIIPNGIEIVDPQASNSLREEVRREFGWADDSRVIAGIGRLSPEKRWDLLLEAAAPLLSSQLRLVLIGAGTEEPTLRDLAASLHIDDHISFLGARADVSRLLAAVDLVVSTSPQETFGLAVLEAVVAGRPVVYVRAPAVDEIGELTGVIKVSEGVEGVRAGLLKGLKNGDSPPLADILGIYDIRKVASQVDQVYAELLTSKGRSK